MAIDTKLKLKLMMQDFPALLTLEGFPVSSGSGSQTGVDSEAANVQLKRGKRKKVGLKWKKRNVEVNHQSYQRLQIEIQTLYKCPLGKKRKMKRRMKMKNHKVILNLTLKQVDNMLFQIHNDRSQLLGVLHCLSGCLYITYAAETSHTFSVKKFKLNWKFS